MAAWWGPAIAAGASILGGFMSKEGQQDANEQNLQISRETSAFNAEQAALNREWSGGQANAQMAFQQQEAASSYARNQQSAQQQMDFQERMSGTSYQRAINDLKQAGLNPMLAYSQGGSSSPAGSAPQSHAPTGAMGQSSAAQGVSARMENILQPAFSSALAAGQVIAGIDKTRAETKEVEARTETEKRRPDLVLSQFSKTKVEENVLTRKLDVMAEQINLTKEQVAKVKQEILNLISEQETDAAHRLLTIIRSQHGDLDLPRAVNEAKAQGTWWKEDVAPFLKDFQGGASSATSVDRILRGGKR